MTTMTSLGPSAIHMVRVNLYVLLHLLMFYVHTDSVLLLCLIPCLCMNINPVRLGSYVKALCVCYMTCNSVSRH